MIEYIHSSYKDSLELDFTSKSRIIVESTSNSSTMVFPLDSKLSNEIVIERAEPLPLLCRDISISHQASLNDGVNWVADISRNGNLNSAEILGTSSLDLSFENSCLFSDLTEEL